MSKPIICVDFDGVIHGYSKGWCDGLIYDPVVPGFFEWAERAAEHFNLVVYSSRSATAAGQLSMATYLEREARKLANLASAHAHYTLNSSDTIALSLWFDSGKLFTLTFTGTKPAAYLTIDDRALQFRGDWGAWWLAPERLLAFKPWTAGDQGECDPRPWQEIANDKLRAVAKMLVDHCGHDPKLTVLSAQALSALVEIIKEAP